MILEKEMEARREFQDPRADDSRSEYDRDEARLIHSAAFRRLQSKTQVLGLGESDFYRTRLTHSMEVAQIGRGLVQYLAKKGDKKYTGYLPNMELISAICLAHDIGHPPFGHGGEVALNYCMRKYGGFEGNGQTLRILGKLDKYTDEHGLNPTRRMLLGVLKYPVSYNSLVNNAAYGKHDNSLPTWLFKANIQKPPKCFHDIDKDIVNFILEPFSLDDREKFTASKKYQKKNAKDKKIPETEHLLSQYKSLDCTIMNLADNISYSLHDLEDALSLGMITEDVWRKYFQEEYEGVSPKDHFTLVSKIHEEYEYEEITRRLFESSHDRKHVIGSLVNLMISNTVIVENGSGCSEPILKYEARLTDDVESLRDAIFKLVFKVVVKDENVQQLEFKGQKLIIELFQALETDPERFLPKQTKVRWERAAKLASDKLSDTEPKAVINEAIKQAQMRVICDFVSGMTDDYATKFYEKLFTPSKGSIFDRL
jgi:dGTPase